MKKEIILIAASLCALTVVSQPILAGTQSLQNSTGKLNHGSGNSTLPYWLEGTILDGSKRVIVTYNGRPPSDATPLEYDYILSFKQEQHILDQARARYIEKYHIDPYSMKEDAAIPAHGAATNLMNDVVKPSSIPLGGGPHRLGWKMELKVFYAKDEEHRPDNINALKSKTSQGWNRFFQFALFPFITYNYGYWSAAGAGTDSFDILDSLKEQCGKYQRHYYQVVLGWVSTANHNGCTYCPYFFVMCTENCWPDAPKDTLVQHELSHAIGWIPDDPQPDSDIGWHRGGFNPCLVNYFYLYSGTKTWCTTCKHIMQQHINHG